MPLSVVATIMGWSAATTAIMGKRYGHIGDSARRSAVRVLESGGKSQSTGHKIGHNWTTTENAGPTTH